LSNTIPIGQVLQGGTEVVTHLHRTHKLCEYDDDYMEIFSHVLQLLDDMSDLALAVWYNCKVVISCK